MKGSRGGALEVKGSERKRRSPRNLGRKREKGKGGILQHTKAF